MDTPSAFASLPPGHFSEWSLAERLNATGPPGWAIVVVGLFLPVLFVVQLVTKRTVGSILACLAIALLPLVLGVFGLARNALEIHVHFGMFAVGDPAAVDTLIVKAITPLALGAFFSSLGLLATALLGLLGPTKVPEPPP